MERKEVLQEIEAALRGGLSHVEGELASINGGGQGELAIAADHAVDTIALNCHLNWRSDAAWNGGQWKQPFIDLGVRNVRSGMFRNTGAINDWKAIGANLILVTAAGDQFEAQKPQIADTLDLCAENAGITLAIEGANEPNQNYHSGWETRTREFQQWLYNETKKRPAIASKPILGPSVWGREDKGYAGLGDMTGMLTATNLHYYTGGCRPTITSEGPDSGSSSTLDDAIDDCEEMGPGCPIWITETGWGVDGPNLPLSAWYVTESAQGKYLPRMWAEAYRRGIVNTALYSLLDDNRNPPRYHGMMDRSFEKRTSFFAMQSLIELYADPGGAFTPGELEFAAELGVISRLPLMQRRDGSFLLTLWNDADSYDRKTFQNVDVPLLPVTIDFGSSVDYRVFLPGLDSEPVDSGKGASLSLGVPDHLLVLEISK